MKAVLFGAGEYGRLYTKNCPKDIEIIAVCDNHWKKLTESEETLLGYKAVSPEMIPRLVFDRIIITVNHKTPNGRKMITEIKNQLNTLGVANKKIALMSLCSNAQEAPRIFEFPRVQFLYDFAMIVYERRIEGAVAECGVLYGDYSYHINNAFRDRRLYLFDTFENFPKCDVDLEDNKVKEVYSKVDAFLEREQSDEIALMKCLFRDNVIVKKGYVPNTFDDVTDDKFAYVHLDTDLYAPTIAGLRFFASRMSTGGIIAVHDYFSEAGFFSGVRKAVNEFCAEYSHSFFPVGDGASIVIPF